MEAIGLTRSQWHVLVYVLKMDAPSQTALAEALDIARPSVGALIDQLENSGYVSRERDAHDRRVWRIMPTQLASQRAEAFAQSAERVATQVFASIEDRDLSAAMALLSTLRKSGYPRFSSNPKTGCENFFFHSDCAEKSKNPAVHTVYG